MIIYKYKKDGYIQEMNCGDDGPNIMRSNTGNEYAYDFVEYVLKYYISKLYDKDVTGKRILDVGMGNGNVLRYVRELLGADVFGYDISDYLNFENRYKGRTFTNTDIRDMPKELLGTFDIAYQRYFSVPFKDITEVLLAISNALKPNGIYLVTLGDDIYTHDDSFVIKSLNEIYDKVVVKKNSYNHWTCIASKRLINPTVTPVNRYYYVLNDEEYEKYWSADSDEQRQMILTLNK
jgi:SAM-dependent methyltransferase